MKSARMPFDRRQFAFAGIAGLLAAASRTSRALPVPVCAGRTDCNGPLKIADVELLELTGHYETQAGVNGQAQVNPIDIYDPLRPPEYHDRPGGAKRVVQKAIYIRIRTDAGLDGLYGPIEEDAAVVVRHDLRPFLLGKDALRGEALWDQMYRLNRHGRAGFFLMAISSVDNALWDLRGRYYGVPVYRLLGGPTRESVEVYASCLGFSLEPEAVRTRCLAIQKEGYGAQKWFIGYGPGSGAEGMRKNVELVRILRETLGDDTELMFDASRGWDQTYALEWAHQVEKYHPRWLEEESLPDQIESFAAVHRGTTIPIASGEHFYGRWEVERYLKAGAVQVVQADPEWCGGISELLKIGTVASLYDVPVIPHGHCIHAAIHVIASQSPMTFPMGEYLINKMRHFYQFEKRPPFPEKGRFALPTGPGFNIELDPAQIDSQKSMLWE